MRSWKVQVASNSTQGLAPLEGRGEVSDSNRTLYEQDFKCIILSFVNCCCDVHDDTVNEMNEMLN